MINQIETTRQKLLRSGKKIINLSSGNPNEHGIFFDQNILKSGFREFLKNPAYSPDPKGDLACRKAIKSWYSARGLKINADQIILTSGTSESYFYLFKMLATTKSDTGNAKILFPNPGYPLFEEIARLAGTELSFYKLDEKNGWQIDIKDLESKIDQRTAAIVLISPNNPTGSILNNKTLRQVIDLAGKNSLAIISDEVFSEFIFDRKKFPRVASMSRQTNIFTLNGISKTYALPGLKLSWIIATGPNKTQNIDELERSADTFLSCNLISQAMLPSILGGGAKFLKSFRKKVESNRNMAIQILNKSSQISFHQPQGGFYLFAKINPGKAESMPTADSPTNAKINPASTSADSITDEQFVIKLMEQTCIFAHPGYFYDYDKEIFILISLLLPAKKLKSALNKILKILRK